LGHTGGRERGRGLGRLGRVGVKKRKRELGRAKRRKGEREKK
jgi:hypothetical protein